MITNSCLALKVNRLLNQLESRSETAAVLGKVAFTQI